MEKEGRLSIQEFSFEHHGDVYHRWFAMRKAEKPIDEIVSPTGLVCCWRNIPIAIGFLCKTDSRMAMITNIISEPNCLSHVRNDCVNELIKALVEVADDEGFLFLSSATSLPSMIERFEKLGFTKTHSDLINFGRSYGMGANCPSNS